MITWKGLISEAHPRTLNKVERFDRDSLAVSNKKSCRSGSRGVLVRRRSSARAR